MKFFISVIIVACFGNVAISQVTKQYFTLGEVLTMKSAELDESRTINIYASPATKENETYQVIYLLDGGADEDFIHVAGLVQFATFPWVNQLPPTILVGIANTDRRGQMTFSSKFEKYKKDFPTAGSSAAFMRFIQNELMPLIEENYSTNGQSTVIGQSLAGLFATEMLFKKPELFQRYIIISPSLWWDEQSLLSQEISFSGNENPQVFVAVGEEGEEMIGVANALVEKLSQKEIAPFFHFMSDHNHANIHHLAIYKAFEVLFQQKNKK